MKLILYEIKKLCGIRYLWVLLAIMSVMCAGVFYYTSGGVTADKSMSRAVSELVAEYNKSPERIEAVRESWQAYQDELRKIENSMHAQLGGGEPDDDFYDKMNSVLDSIVYEDKFGYTYPDGEVIHDSYLLAQLEYAEHGRVAYRESVDSVIKNAKAIMIQYELLGATDLPVYEFERHIVEKYTAARDSIDVSSELHYVYGWVNYLHFDEIGVFIYVYLILAAGVIFLHERSCGTQPILRTAKKGRIKTTASKLAAMIVMDIAVVFVFTAVTFAVCYIVFGFSSASDPLQASIAFYNCPYQFSFGQYAVVVFLMRCMCAVTFSCIVSLTAALTFSPVATYATGAFVLISSMVVNFLLSSSNWIHINLIGMMSNSVMETYSEVITFGHFRPTLLTGLVIYAIAASAASAVMVTAGGRRSVVPYSRTAAIIRNLIGGKRSSAEKSAPAKAAKERVRRYPSSPFAWEMQKLFTPSVTCVLAGLLVLSAYETYVTYSEPISAAASDYEAYINDNLFGKLTEEKREWIDERMTELSEILSKERREEMDAAIMSGEISFKEYTAYIDECGEADIERGLLSDAEKQLRYLDEVGGGWFMPDTALRRMLGRDINVLLFVAIVIVFGRIYTVDFAGKSSEGDFANIMRTTKNGRRVMFYAKLRAVLVCAVMITAAFEAVEFAAGILTTDRFFDILSAPMMSMKQYSAMSGISVGAYTALTAMIRFISYIILAYLTCVASYAVKKLPPTLLLVALFTLLPYALVYMGMLTLRYIDFTAMLAGGKLLTRSATFAVAGGTYTFAVLLLCGYLMLTVTAIFAVRHKTGK